jgi:ABC-type nickel/cobalt efflux system permease component RcnA
MTELSMAKYMPRSALPSFSSIAADHGFEAAEGEPEPFRQSSLAQDETLWIRGLDVALNITLGLCLVAAVIVLIYYAAEEAFGLGLLLAAALAVGGFLTVAGLKVFIGMAKDLKAIRNKMEQ